MATKKLILIPWLMVFPCVFCCCCVEAKPSKWLPGFGQFVLWEGSPHRVSGLLFLETTPEHLLYVCHGEGAHRGAWDTRPTKTQAPVTFDPRGEATFLFTSTC